jgi:hypothetical protein
MTCATRPPGRFAACLWVFLALGQILSCSLPAGAQTDVNVLTNRNDNARTGVNPKETILNTSNVVPGLFGRLFSQPVDERIVGQPLYLSQVSLPGKGTHNLVFVTTRGNSVYAFDADDNQGLNAHPIWHDQFPWVGNPQNTYLAGNIPQQFPDHGILSTPVIDPGTGTIYVVVLTSENFADGVSNVFRLHALDIYDGSEKFGGPVVITGSVPGTGAGSSDGTVIFNANRQFQRPGLLLLNGIVYITFGSASDVDPYHGWIFGYDTQSLQQTTLWNATPNGNRAGIWQSGVGLAADAQGYIYTMTGNGSYNVSKQNFGDSLVKLDTANGLTVVDWFTPYNQNLMELHDLDLGSSGPILMPNTNYIFGGGKQGILYLVDTTNMGHSDLADNSQIVQNFQATIGHIHCSPVFWNSPQGSKIYVWSEQDYLKCFALINGLFTTTPIAQSAMPVPDGMPGGMLSLSANGSAPGTAILWASHPFKGDASAATVPGIFRAFDAATLTELWDSKLSSYDDIGNFAKFTPPTIANGKVYMATFSNQLVVYGLLHAPPASPAITPGGGFYVSSVKVSLSSTTPGVDVRYTLDGSLPTAASPLYKSSLTLTGSAVVKARAFKTGLQPSAITSAAFSIANGTGSGGVSPTGSPTGSPISHSPARPR